MEAQSRGGGYQAGRAGLESLGPIRLGRAPCVRYKRLLGPCVGSRVLLSFGRRARLFLRRGSCPVSSVFTSCGGCSSTSRHPGGSSPRAVNYAYSFPFRQGSAPCGDRSSARVRRAVRFCREILICGLGGCLAPEKVVPSDKKEACTI